MQKRKVITLAIFSILAIGAITAFVSCKSRKNNNSSSSIISETSSETKTCTILLNSLYYGVSYDSITGEVGSALSLPTPEREGFEFLGWYKDSSLKKVFIETTFPDKDCTLYAKWEVKEYTISFDVYGTGNYDSKIYQFGENIEYPTPSTSGYYFIGWYYNDLLFLETKMPAKNIVLVGSWKAIEYKYTYELNQGVNDPGNKTSYTLEDDNNTLIVPTRYGYTFEGWYTDQNFNNRVYTYPLFNATLYAKWSKNVHTVTLESDFGDLDEKEFEYYFGDIVKLPTLKRDGMVFEGWYDEDDVLSEMNFDMQDQDIIFTAKWSYVEYDITYVLDGGKFNDEPIKNYTVDTKSELIRPYKEGYTFIGWYIDNQLTIPLSKLTLGDITLYAKYKVNQYYINLDYGYDNITEAFPRDFNSEVELPTPKRTGYKFLGWYRKDSDVAETKVTIPCEDIQFYAQWEINKHTLKINVGSNLTSDIVEYGKEILFPNPELDGYTFIGWYVDDKIISTDNFTMPDKDTTIVAKYNINTYHVQYDSDITFVNKYVTSYDVEDNLTLIIPSKGGYNFLGWYLVEGDKETKIDSLPLKDCFIISKWEIATYSIKYNYSGKGISQTLIKEYTIMDEITLPTIVRECCDFGGWFYVDENGNNIIIDKIVAGSFGDLVLHAIENDYFSIGENTIIGITDYAVEKFANSTLVIPSSVDGVPIYTIGKLKTYVSNTISKVQINNGITTISALAFSGWVDLEEITIPSSVVSIGQYAFACTSIAELDLTNMKDVTTLSEGAIANMGELKTLRLPSKFVGFKDLVTNDINLEEIYININKYEFENLMEQLNFEDDYDFGSTSDYAIIFNDDTRYFKDKTCQIKISITFPDDEDPMAFYPTFIHNENTEIALPTCLDPDYYYKYTGTYRSVKKNNGSECKIICAISIHEFLPYSIDLTCEKVFGYTSYFVKIKNLEGAVGAKKEYEVDMNSGTINLPLSYKKFYVSDGYYESPTFEEDTRVSQLTSDLRRSMYLYCKWKCIYTIEDNQITGITDVYPDYLTNYICEYSSTLRIYPFVKEDGTKITEVGGSFESTYYDMISIESGITTIRSNAFSNIWTREIHLPNSIKTIELNAFYPSYGCQVYYDGTLAEFKKINIKTGSIGTYAIQVNCSDDSTYINEPLSD